MNEWAKDILDWRYNSVKLPRMTQHAETYINRIDCKYISFISQSWKEQDVLPMWLKKSKLLVVVIKNSNDGFLDIRIAIKT